MLLLVDDELAVDDHVKYAFPLGKEHCFQLEVLFELGGQTGRLRFVVSLCAVMYYDVHFCSLIGRLTLGTCLQISLTVLV